MEKQILEILLDVQANQLEMQKDISSMKKDIKDLQANQASMQKDITSMKKDIKDLQANQASMQNDIKDLQANQASMQKDIQTLIEGRRIDSINIAKILEVQVRQFQVS